MSRKTEAWYENIRETDNELGYSLEASTAYKNYPKTEFNSEFTPSQKFETLKIMQKIWIGRLTPSEFHVVFFIWCRTVFWGKGTEFIKYRHFIEGIPDVIDGVPFAERRLKDILDALVKKEILFRDITQTGSFYTLDFEWDTKRHPSASGKKLRKKRAELVNSSRVQRFANKVKNGASRDAR